MHTLTIVIPNRERDFKIVRRTLHSISQQITNDIEVVVVDYGSPKDYQKELKITVNEIPRIKVVCYPVQYQLWNKSKAINTVLKQCQSLYFMVADMDLIFHPQFVQRVIPNLNPNEAIYFPVGILTKEESKKELPFEEYIPKFITNEEATGISIFPTELIKQLNGFDEFYNGWGSEDTDMHVRLQNNGNLVRYLKEALYFLHQWHPKNYRIESSALILHTNLERINAAYLNQVRLSKKTIANKNREWGVIGSEEDYKELLSPSKSITFKIKKPKEFKSILKQKLKKSVVRPISLEEVNNRLLYSIITALSHCPYRYSFDRQKEKITCAILLK